MHTWELPLHSDMEEIAWMIDENTLTLMMNPMRLSNLLDGDSNVIIPDAS